jgi:CNT family concentrative nucleoside transporter
MERLQPLIGLLLIGLIAYALSTNRKAIRARTILWGFSLQFVFALLVLKTSQGQWLFGVSGEKVRQLLGFSAVGSSFVFGVIGNQPVWARS